MVIHIHQSVHKQNFVDKTEFARASKHRLGCKPVTMSQRVTIKGLRDKINTAFKRELTIALKRYFRLLRHDVACTVETPHGTFRVVPRKPEEWANRLANLMLIEIKKAAKPMGLNGDRDNITSLAKVFETKKQKERERITQNKLKKAKQK